MIDLLSPKPAKPPGPDQCTATFTMKDYAHECSCVQSRNHAPSINHVCGVCGTKWNSGGIQKEGESK